MNTGTSSLLRISVQPFSSFLRASLVPSTASTLPSFETPAFVGFLTFLYWVLSLFFIHTSLSALFHISLSTFFFINRSVFTFWLPFLLPKKACWRNAVNSNVWCSSPCFSLNYYTSIIFILHKCRNFFSVAQFCAAIVVFSARFGAGFCCFYFAFC